MASGGSKPRSNPIVGKIVKDPKSPPHALCLRGFVGDSSEDISIRLYFGPNSSDDVPQAAILHSEPVPEAWSPFGAMYLWIERDAELIHGSERFEALCADWRIETLIHGDVKWDNVVVHRTSQDASLELKLVDWELADFGDRAWGRRLSRRSQSCSSPK